MAGTTPQQIADSISEKSHNASHAGVIAAPPLHKRTYQACVRPTLSKSLVLANLALHRFLAGRERFAAIWDLLINLTTLHVSDVAAKPRSATSPPLEENGKQTVRMGNPQERRHQMRNMRHTFPGERVLELLALFSHCHMDRNR